MRWSSTKSAASLRCTRRSITRAAESYHVSQPALTRAIRKMEEGLGGLLFSREGCNTHMTELGRLIEPHMVEMMARAGKAKQAAARCLKLEDARLAVGVMCTIAPVQFVNFLARFRADNPGIDVTLLEPVPERLCDMLAKGEVDVALMSPPYGFPAPLRAVELYSERGQRSPDVRPYRGELLREGGDATLRIR